MYIYIYIYIYICLKNRKHKKGTWLSFSIWHFLKNCRDQKMNRNSY